MVQILGICIVLNDKKSVQTIGPSAQKNLSVIESCTARIPFNILHRTLIVKQFVYLYVCFSYYLIFEYKLEDFVCTSLCSALLLRKPFKDSKNFEQILFVNTKNTKSAEE